MFVIGGGPAGLAAALAARQIGLDVILADRAQPPIDKACGEGLMPDALDALRRIGVNLGSGNGVCFRGIRFLDEKLEAEATFSNHSFGLGIRRTELHRILVERAKDVGVVALWGKKIEGIDTAGVVVDGRTVRCRWIVGADGFHSNVRRWAGLAPNWNAARRIGLRQHFRVRPWTDFVEVYWRKDCQAYVTPVGVDEVCVATIGREDIRGSDLVDMFPVLASHLGGAELIGPTRGAISKSTRLPIVVAGRIALVGDASGSVDAVTGEGLALAFRQANSLAAALAAGDLRRYDASHRRMGRMPRLMARTLLLFDGNDRLRRMAFRNLAAHPRIFSRLLDVHVGALRRSALTAIAQPLPRADIEQEARHLPQNGIF
ncbi:FAD-dependent monooxygenase [Bradyrhizobium sp.]|uniref:NAD(P)/FAD-dependent oxidoreductase n=1 Tax=Bradyrhizobium sp. TaxID=376 RepID=UPI0025C4E936|nr:FAD-dependent monooxygenase [Bradyrhizobium sp.]